MNIEQPKVIDLLSNQQGPALSSTNDLPVVETKPDAQNEGAPPAVPTEETQEAEQLSESATETTDEQDGQQAGDAPRGVGKALAKLRQERREAEERERAAQERLDKALAALEALKKPEPEVVKSSDEPARPNKADFTDPDAWELAMLDYAEQRASWAAQKEVKRIEDEAKKKAELTAAEEATKKTVDAFNQRTQKVKDKYSDFDQVVNTPDVLVSQAMTHVIVNSEHGPELQYYLGKNPEDAKRILALPVADQLIEAGLIIAKMRAPAQPISAAPKPITPSRSGGTTTRPSLEEASMDDYVAMRKEQQKASVRH